MSNINQIANALSAIATSGATKTNNGKDKDKSENITSSADIIYQPSEKAKEASHKADMEKVRSMKEETDANMLKIFTDTVNHGFIKQLGGLRGALEKVLNGEKVEGLNIEVTEESIAKAQEDIAPGGYWSPEKTSDRFLEFAKALSGDDPSKSNLLIDAFKEGYKKAEEAWGGTLPDISKKTYDLTLKKFDEWAAS